MVGSLVNRHVTVNIRWIAASSLWRVTSPDIPSLLVEDASRDTAVANARAAIIAQADGLDPTPATSIPGQREHYVVMGDASGGHRLIPIRTRYYLDPAAFVDLPDIMQHLSEWLLVPVEFETLPQT